MIRWALPRAVVIGVVLALLLAGLGGTGAETVSGRLGGDFPAFYGAGRLILEGKQADMYAPEVQQQVQSDLFLESDAFLYFAYPPYTALPYAGLASLPYRVAFVLHGLLSMIALWGAVRLARPMLPRLLRGGEDDLMALAVLLATYPILRSVVGGQNTTFTILLIVAVWHAAEKNRPIMGGLALAGLLYKPQYGLLMVLVVLAARRFRFLAWWSMGAIMACGLGTLVLGVDWPSIWLDQVATFNDENLRVNGYLMVSAIGWMVNLASGDAFGVALGVAVAVSVGAIAMAIVWRLGLGARSMSVVMPAMVLASPSALYYDAGIAVGTLGVGLDRVDTERGIVVSLVVATSWLQLAAETLGWSPLFLWLVALFGGSLAMLFFGQRYGHSQ